MSGEFLNHFGAARLRVEGTGNLNMTYSSLDNTNELILAPITMINKTNQYTTVITNFIDWNCQLIGSTSNLGDNFIIKDILIYVKPTYTGLPQ